MIKLSLTLIETSLRIFRREAASIRALTIGAENDETVRILKELARGIELACALAEHEAKKVSKC